MAVSRGLVAAVGMYVALLAAPVARAAEPMAATMALPATSLSFSFEYIAEDMGLYDKRGVHMKSIVLPGVGSTNGVISGSVEFGVSAGTSMTRAAARGQRLLAIALTSNRVITQVVLRKEFAKGFDPKAPFAQRGLLLKDRTIAVDAINSLIDAYVVLMGKRAGLSADAIHIAVMQPPNMEAAFAAKQIDGFAMSPPWTQMPVLDGSAVMIASGPDGEPAEYVPFANNVIVAKPETCSSRRTLCEAVGQASAEGMRYLREHPDEALAIVKKHFATLDDKVVATAFAVIRKITPDVPVATDEGLSHAEQFNVDAGLLKPEEKLKSYDGLYTDAFVK